VKLGGNFILLGASPIPSIQEEFAELKEQYSDCDQVLLEYSYDEILAHQIYASCDFLIVPSLFEPCGLSQMIALRYGTLPIVRSTGGLKDTVFDYENPVIPAAQRNGIVFHSFSIEAVQEAVRRAIALWGDETTFHWLIRHGMQQEFGWRKPGSRYLRMYEKELTPDDELPKDIPLPSQLNKKRQPLLTRRSPLEEILPK
jgi:starch synthase